MKLLIKILILIVLTGVVTSCSKEKNDLKLWNLKGNVKSVLVKRHKAEWKFGEWTSGNGTPESKTFFDEKGNIEWTELYSEYDGELIRKFITKIKDENTSEIYGYDEKGEIISTSVQNKLDNKLESIWYNKEGITFAVYVDVYENDRLIKQNAKDFKDDEVVSESNSTFEYDENGNLVIQKIISSYADKITYKYEYLAFDEHNNWIKRLAFDIDKGKDSAEIFTQEIEYY